MVPIDAVRRLLEASAERSGVEGFGLLMAEARRLSNLGPLGLLIREQPTLRLALEALVRYGDRLNEALFLTIEESRRRRRAARGTDRRAVRDPCGSRPSSRSAWRSGCCARSWAPTGGRDASASRTTRPPTARSTSACSAATSSSVTTSTASSARAPTSRCPIRTPIPRLRASRGRCSRRNPRRASRGHVDAQVRELVVMLLGTGTCTIDRVAQHLGVDRRTVHRRLANEGETFSGLVDAVRRELAERYVEDPNRSLAEVSLLLGFSAPSGFSRWYRQRFKAKPSEQRARTGRT